MTLSHTRGVEREEGMGILIRACTTVQTPSRGTNGRSFLSAEAEKRDPAFFHRSDWSDWIPSPSALVLSVITEEGEKWSVWKGLEEEVWLVGSGAVI